MAGILEKYMFKQLRIKYFIISAFVLFCGIFFGTDFSIADEILPENKIIIIFRNDDPSAISDITQEKKVFEIFRKHRVPQVFGVIPYAAERGLDVNNKDFHLLPENQAMFNLLKEWREEGFIEIALHGYTHQTNYLHPGRFESNGILLIGAYEWSEFSGLPFEEQLGRILKGKQLLESWFNGKITTFILPFNSLDKNTIRAAEEADLKVVCGYVKNADSFLIANRTKGLLFLQHTVDLSNFDETINIYKAGLEKFKIALANARESLKTDKKTVLMVVLYHSNTIKSPEDFKLLNNIIKEVSSAEDIIVMTQDDLLAKFSDNLKGLFYAKKRAHSAIRKVKKLFSIIGRESPVMIDSGFIVFDADYYMTKKGKAVDLYWRFYLVIVGMALLLVSIVNFSVLWLGLEKTVFVSCLFTLNLIALVGYLTFTYLGLLGFEPGIGALDSIVLLFGGIMLAGLIAIYFYNKIPKNS